MARTFSSAMIQVATGALGAFTHGSIVMIVRNVGGGGVSRWGLYTQTREMGLGLNSGTALRMNMGGNLPVAPTITVTSSDGYVLIAATKATGTVAVRFHKYSYVSNTWTHEDQAGTTANASSGTISSTVIGAQTTGAATAWDGQIAAAAIWQDVALADAQIESMAPSLTAWTAAAPTCMWVLDQSATTQGVVDWTGGGANQSSITSTSVATASVYVLTYGHPIMVATRGAGGAPPPATSQLPYRSGYRRNMHLLTR